MNLDKLMKDGQKRLEAEQRRRANAIHEAGTEHVTARINELHHLLGLTIEPAFLKESQAETLEAELLEAVNRARAEVDKKGAGSDPIRRVTELMIGTR